MERIIAYIFNMMPYILCSFPMLLIGRIIYVKKKRIKIYWYYEISWMFFFLFFIGLGSLTILPKIECSKAGFIFRSYGRGHVNLLPGKVFYETFYEVVKNHNVTYFLINFLGNVVMFLPIGFFLPFLWKFEKRSVLWIGFGISLFIECCQLFIGRGTDIDDLWLNTLGVLLGDQLFILLFHKFGMNEIKSNKIKIESKVIK